jgi:hypothetical protein
VTNANDKYFEPKPVHGFEQPQVRGRDVNSLEAGTNISACTQVCGCGCGWLCVGWGCLSVGGYVWGWGWGVC